MNALHLLLTRSLFLLAGAMLALCWPSFAASPATAPSGLAIFEQQVAEIAKSEDMVGLAVAVVRGGEVAMLRTYGRREIGSEGKIGPHTKFRIASLSKAFATGAIVQLIDEGKLSLTDQAALFAPDFKLKDTSQLQAATLENVMSHRLGLPPYAYDNLLEAGVPPRTILRRLGDVDMICPVGRCYAYQNVAFNILADAVESADGKAFDEAVAARLFAPLGLEGASFNRDGLQREDDWARSHRRNRGRSWRVVDVRTPYYGVPAAGGVNASITDMAYWLRAQMGYAPDVLPADLLRMMHDPKVKTPVEVRRVRSVMSLDDAHYGFGWRIYDYRGEKIVNHSGSVGGYSAQIAFLPDRDVGIVLLTNSRSKPFWSILPAFLDAELSLDNAAASSETAPAKALK